MRSQSKLRRISNSSQYYGWASIVLHWVMAFVLISLYFLGDYMVDLDYYNTWYHTGPVWHKSLGILMGVMLLARFIWTYAQARPALLEDRQSLVLMGKLAHLALYFLTATLVLSGYLISTAKGKGIDLFGWFELPAIFPKGLGEEGYFRISIGDAHAYLALAFILLVSLHAFAALVHHFFFKDRTLKRMLWVRGPKA